MVNIGRAAVHYTVGATSTNTVLSSNSPLETLPLPHSWFRFDVLAEPHDIAVPALVLTGGAGSNGLMISTTAPMGSGGGAGGVYVTSYGAGGAGGQAGGSYNTMTTATPNSTLRP